MGIVSKRQKPDIQEIDRTAFSPVGGTEADNIQPIENTLQESFQPDIYRFIVSSIESIEEGPIKSLKDRVNEYKKECKRLQEKYEEEIQKNSKLEGQFKILERYGIAIVGFVILQAFALIGTFFGYINPILSNVKTDNNIPKNETEHIKSIPNSSPVHKK